MDKKKWTKDWKRGKKEKDRKVMEKGNRKKGKRTGKNKKRKKNEEKKWTIGPTFYEGLNGPFIVMIIDRQNRLGQNETLL
jgi:hypothetical protein